MADSDTATTALQVGLLEAQFGDLSQDLTAIDNRMEAIEDIVLSDPADALEMPMVASRVDTVQAQLTDEANQRQREDDQLADLIWKTVGGAVLTLLLAALGFTLKAAQEWRLGRIVPQTVSPPNE